MIRHIFTLIWNERKTNALIVLEFVAIFCILWFCCDYLWFVGSRWLEPRGFDIEHTYQLNLGLRTDDVMTAEQIEQSKDDLGNALRLIELAERYPGVEAATISNSGLPYTESYNGSTSAVDSTHIDNLRVKGVTPSYFDVFRIGLKRGRVFGWPDPAQKYSVIITPDHKDEFLGYPTGEVEGFYGYNTIKQGDAPNITVLGVTEKIKMEDFEPYKNTFFEPVRNFLYYEVALRVTPKADDGGFAERFYRDMRASLDFGSKYLLSVTPMSDLRREYNEETYNTLNGVFAVMGFLVVNIFIGVLGTFWLRTQSRRAQIGLRMALGSSRRGVQRLLASEAMVLLAISSVVGAAVCLSIGQTDLLGAIGVPSIDRESYGVGHGQDAIDFVVTFVFLAAVSFLAIWYPARQAAKTQPAEVLHEE